MSTERLQEIIGAVQAEQAALAQEQAVQRKHPLAVCEKCPFQKRSMAATTGPADAKIAIVSRSPGYHESLSGKSFSGLSGKVLDHLLQVHGTNREEVLATNVVLCQSDGADQEPGFALAQSCCEPRLEAEITNAETVIACGREAAYGVLGVTNISQNRGYVHYREVEGGSLPVRFKQRVIVTNNPAVVVRDDASYPELVRDFRLALDPLPEPKLPKVRWIDDLDEARVAVAEMLVLMDGKLVASDIETRGSGRGVESSGLSHTAQIVCAGFSIRPERAVVFGERVCLDDSFLHNELSNLWKIESARYLWHNGKYDVKVLRSIGINARVDEDTMLLSWCLDERPGDPESGAGGHSLEWLLKDELGWPKYEPASVRTFKKTGILEDQRARIDLYEYNGFDTAGSLGLFEVLEARARHDGVFDRPYRSLLRRLSEAFTRIELQGNLFDVDRACDLLEYEVWPKLRDQKIQLRQISGKKTLNPNSPLQLTKLIYDEWGVTHDLVRPKIERVGKRSTDKWVREAMLLGLYKCRFDGSADHAGSADNPSGTEVIRNSDGDVVTRSDGRVAIDQFIQTLNDFKQLDTIRSRYLEGLTLKRYPNGRIYTDFKIHGTESGRVSSSNPNLQNIVRSKDGAPNIRGCFLADPGCVLISADLSQAELRTIAVLSGDPTLQAIYTETGRSLHKEVAAQFYGENYTYEQYVKAKNLNFGIAYWQSAYSFAQMYHMPREEAQKYIDFWWSRFPKVWEWTKSMEKQVVEVGEIQSPFGHKRRFYVIPADEGARIHTVKQGINFLPQNIAANITLWALCNLCDRLDWEIAQPRITVHDSILVNCRKEYVNEVAPLVKQCLEDAPKEAIGWDFPYLAELSVGSNWGDLHELEL
jgi:uracil-DNA glycosylase family 4